MLYFKLSLVFILNVLAIKCSHLKDDRVVNWNYGGFIFRENKSIEYSLEIFSPTIPGNYPVVLFLTGLNGGIPASFYSDQCTDISIEANAIVVVFDKLRLAKFPLKDEKIVENSLNWTIENIDNLFNNDKTPFIVKGLVFPDIKSYGVNLMGHSSACHPIVGYLNNTCGLFKSLILLVYLDPVDGYDPFGFIKIFITNPPKQLPFQIPTLIMSSKLGSIPENAMFPPCTPVNVSNIRFYESLSGPTWYLNFTGYGHADVLDSTGRKLNKICKTCQVNCDYPLYQKNVARAISYFLAGLQNKNANLFEALEDPKDSSLFDLSIQILPTFKHNGFDVIKTGPFCQHNKYR